MTQRQVRLSSTNNWSWSAPPQIHLIPCRRSTTSSRPTGTPMRRRRASKCRTIMSQQQITRPSANSKIARRLWLRPTTPTSNASNTKNRPTQSCNLRHQQRTRATSLRQRQRQHFQRKVFKVINKCWPAVKHQHRINRGLPHNSHSSRLVVADSTSSRSSRCRASEEVFQRSERVSHCERHINWVSDCDLARVSGFSAQTENKQIKKWQHF